MVARGTGDACGWEKEGRKVGGARAEGFGFVEVEVFMRGGSGTGAVIVISTRIASCALAGVGKPSQKRESDRPWTKAIERSTARPGLARACSARRRAAEKAPGVSVVDGAKRRRI